MSAENWLRQLEAYGVNVSVRNDDLVCRTKATSIPEHLIAAIRSNKQSILDALKLRGGRSMSPIEGASVEETLAPSKEDLKRAIDVYKTLAGWQKKYGKSLGLESSNTQGDILELLKTG